MGLLTFLTACGGHRANAKEMKLNALHYWYAPMSRIGAVSYRLVQTTEGVSFYGKFWRREDGKWREVVVDTIVESSVMEDIAALVAAAGGAGKNMRPPKTRVEIRDRPDWSWELIWSNGKTTGPGSAVESIRRYLKELVQQCEAAAWTGMNGQELEAISFWQVAMARTECYNYHLYRSEGEILFDASAFFVDDTSVLDISLEREKVSQELFEELAEIAKAAEGLELWVAPPDSDIPDMARGGGTLSWSDGTSTTLGNAHEKLFERLKDLAKKLNKNKI